MNTIRLSVLAASVAACLAASPALAQHAGHAMPAPAKKPQPASPVDSKEATPAIDHSKMDHSEMDHSKMDHSRMEHGAPASPSQSPPREPIPAVTDADRAAAFPPVHHHHAHGTAIHHLTVIDRLEFSPPASDGALGWEAQGWIGGDVRKFHWRSEGHAHDGKIERARVEAMCSVGVRAWWDVVAGVRHDFGEGPGRQWVGVGVQGVMPYKFEASATFYAGPQGRTALVAEAEYDTLLTNRLILQWRVEADAHGRDDPRLGVGAGLSTVEAGARLRYEITRQFAPYIGIEHARAFGRTADFRQQAGDPTAESRFVAGVRIWF